MHFKRTIKALLMDAGYWRACHSLRHALFGSNSWQVEQRANADFYSKLVPRSSLCYDIGANCGEITDALRACGCQVIAVEPQREHADAIQHRYAGDKNVKTLCAAIGNADGVGTLFIGSDSRVSSLSTEWIESAKRDERLPGVTWETSRSVPMLSLETLIEQNGVPSYIKVDVEGYEAEVLCGLKKAVSTIEFEATRVNFDIALQVVRHLSQLDTYEYNIFSIHGEKKLARSKWLDACDFEHLLESWPSTGSLLETSNKKANILARKQLPTKRPVANP